MSDILLRRSKFNNGLADVVGAGRTVYVTSCNVCNSSTTHQIEKTEEIGGHNLRVQHYFCSRHAPEGASPVTWRYVE